MFLAVNVFNATLFPPPEVPQINICGFGSAGGPNKSIYIYRGISEHISSYKNSFVMRQVRI